ncbi:hypothetical protein HanRHA438_Chr09g0396691 [Helianthus annuus]|nr:hypothetical protein HanRHA438_Chr09g0396691 [Helianthus annuus]
MKGTQTVQCLQMKLTRSCSYTRIFNLNRHCRSAQNSILSSIFISFLKEFI